MSEKWSVGKHKSVVVSDTKQQNTNFPSPPNPTESSDEDLAYYGGYLVCESIGNDKNAKLIAAAPEMFEILKKIYTERINGGDFDTNEVFKLIVKITE
jgi:hypothetical protein